MRSLSPSEDADWTARHTPEEHPTTVVNVATGYEIDSQRPIGIRIVPTRVSLTFVLLHHPQAPHFVTRGRALWTFPRTDPPHSQMPVLQTALHPWTALYFILLLTRKQEALFLWSICELRRTPGLQHILLPEAYPAPHYPCAVATPA